MAEFPAPRNIKEVRQFLGLASYYRRFISQFAKTASPLHALTRKGASFQWSAECQTAFDNLKEKLTVAPILAYPNFEESFVLETDASIHGLGAILSQKQVDGELHPVAYASRALSPQEKNYAITDLETLAVVWAVTHFHAYLYGHEVTVYTDHSAVKAVLETPSPNGKHARWWTKVYGRGVKKVTILYRSGKQNTKADALSRSPHLPAPLEGVSQSEVQVATITVLNDPTHSAEENLDPSQIDISRLLVSEGIGLCPTGSHFGDEQCRDPDLHEIITFLEHQQLPEEDRRAKKVAAQAFQFTLLDGILFYVNPKDNTRRAAVPEHLREGIMKENHDGPLAGHFAGRRLYNTLSRHWWWDGMYSDVYRYCQKCPQCAISTRPGRSHKPLLQPIPVQRVFQIIGVDIMELPTTERGNRYAIVFQDFLSNWPMVFAAPDQKAVRIARLLVEEIVPMCGVPEALLSDRGTNLLSYLVQEVCKLLGTKKLNTTAYHPQCNGMVERFNRTLKTMLRKHADQFGVQWDQHLPGVLWAYRNTPHDSTGE